MPVKRSRHALVCAALFGAVVVAQVATDRNAPPTCSTSNACFPWDSQAPSCTRGDNINLRFQLDITEPNYITEAGVAQPHRNLTYAFCPRVDELSAFNITRAGEFAFTHRTNVSTNISWMVENEKYLTAIGFGDTNDVVFPQPTSIGRVMVADYFSLARPNGGSQCNAHSEIAIVSFLVLNISLDQGRFRYYAGHPQPAGVGFTPTCDSTNICLLDSSLKCIGLEGQKNCAECVGLEDANKANIQVWASYYGTDSSGRTLRSGASNPLNFQAYSGAGVGKSMQRSFDNVEDGRSSSSDGLEPA